MKKLIVANWKMNKNVREAVFLASDLKKMLENSKNGVVICPSFTALESVSKELIGSSIKLGAQNMHFEEQGAFTGEVSALMLKDLGCEYVILGHSERREFFAERDDIINRKMISALRHSLNPILCVGETLEHRKNRMTQQILESQLKNCLTNIDKKQMHNVTVAYEPIWAISRGDPNHKPATSKDAQEGHIIIRNFLAKIYDAKISRNTPILYGGSMKQDNAKELLSMPDIDGGLVGNASLDAKSFAGIVLSF